MKSLRHPLGPLGFILLALLLGPLFGLLSGCALSSSVPATPTDRYAIVIGISLYCPNYAEGIYPNLTYSDNDAEDMAALLASEGWQVKYELVNSTATYANVKADIASLSTTIGSDKSASILVYYSGHGSISGSTAYIIPQDGITDSGTSYKSDGVTYPNYTSNLAKWITPATLTSWMAAVPAKNRLLILDSCDSGGFALSDSAADLSPSDYSALNGTTKDSGAIATALSKMSSLISANLSNYGSAEVQVLAAAGLDESSYDDSTHGNGAFTYYLLKAAASGDSDGDGVVTMDEAYNYCKTGIKANWDAEYGGWPNDADFLPHISGGSGDAVLYSK